MGVLLVLVFCACLAIKLDVGFRGHFFRAIDSNLRKTSHDSGHLSCHLRDTARSLIMAVDFCKHRMAMPSTTCLFSVRRGTVKMWLTLCHHLVIPVIVI